MLIIFLLLSGCRSTPRDIPDDLHPEEFFRNAQNAVDTWRNFNRAISYYEEFMRRFPDMKGKVIEAEYGIAFIHFRKGNFEEAERRFLLILERYQSPERIHFPEWPRVLSEKVLETMQQRSARTSRSRRG
ncbi:MAG: hypothetical protein FWC36_02565 [Spirochaetes bacterium]|nr:hypothetical protein [Spirochaetota bacterium]